MSSQDDLNALKAQINEMQQQLNSQQTMIGNLSGALQSAYGVSSDVVKTLINAKVVGTNGNLGTLSHADTLAGAPIGDAGRLRGDMGLGELATKGALSDAPVGDADKLRRSMWLGEMAKLSYLDQCEVGQAEKLRTKIGLGELATKGRLSDADVGDARRLRENLNLGEGATLQVVDEGDVGKLNWGKNGILSEGTGAALREYSEKQASEKAEQRVTRTGWGTRHSASAQNAHEPLPSGLYTYSPKSGNAPYGGFGVAMVINNDGPDWRNIVHFPAGGNPPLYSVYTNDKWNVWQCKFVIEGVNSYVDGSGFYKKSSPIFKLCNPDAMTDLGEHFVRAGYGGSNGEASGVIAERVGVGHYVIRNSLGFASEGWTIEAPRDKNNQALVWLDDSQDADGTITVRTYHREHKDAPPFARNSVEGVKDGDPIDIPVGYQVDMRLEMPKKPESSPAGEMPVGEMSPSP